LGLVVALNLTSPQKTNGQRSDAGRNELQGALTMSTLEGRPSEPVRNPHEDVAAQNRADAPKLNDQELEHVAGGYLTYKLKNVQVTSYSMS
jgi:hypothetical protein